MARDPLNDLSAFVAVAEARSFTKAAAQMGLSQSALSHAMRQLEERMGVRLLARTTRSVGLTQAGERLLETVAPHLREIQSGLAALNLLRETPAGVLRLTTNEHAAATIIYPAMARLVRDYPDITVEVSVDNGFTDIVANRFDAGVRLGDLVDQDMVAVRIGPDQRMAVVGTPAYFAAHPVPLTPQDLLAHNCIGMRLPTYGNLLAWEFEKDGQSVSVRTKGQVVANTGLIGHRAVLDGLGLGYCPQDVVADDIAQGRLVRVLDDWCEPFAGYHLYYPSRRQPSPAFALLVEALRHRA
ncbi:LysR family transcriptional regulator [Caulobacter sp. 602-2]|uniref:LysR family transcriptional regulator n=1 Tax=Caulobacter sp. 602-2 TaxID=2710887 RepID=A0A6G4QVS0_9CAUL|nr:LysR family transcriptional regulator [Caulobacter sp. 602-2]NGM49720.1 LysR family transcriptional regulator [Caulobacter sp. 602-2]